MAEQVTPKTEEHPVGYAFRLGNDGEHMDMQIDGERRLYWKPSEHDSTFAPIAHWQTLEQQGLVSPYIPIPEGTRNAGSVLSGTAAFIGEKEQVVDAFLQYMDRSVSETGTVDTSAGLNTLAVTRGEDRRFVMLPPHNGTADAAKITDWVDRVATDMERVLAPSQEEELAAYFRAKATEIAAGL